MGTYPEVSPLAVVIMSGTMPSSLQANIGPVRPNPVMTSSATKRISSSLQTECMAATQPLGGTRTPPDPWIGSR